MAGSSRVAIDTSDLAVVAVIGGGASGALSAMQVARHAVADGRSVRLLVAEPGELAEGLAYSTHDLGHRLNVMASGMSAYPDDSQHFVRWLRRYVDVDYPADGFAARQHYGQYLAQCLADAVLAAPGVCFEHLRAKVTDVRSDAQGLCLTLDDGCTRRADSVVLATGHGDPSVAWAPQTLRKSHRFVPDPWRASSAPAVHPGETVLLVGAGLTMADMAQRWHRRGVRCHVTSRHGMRPLEHATAPTSTWASTWATTSASISASASDYQADPPAVPEATPKTLAEARHLVFEHIRAYDGDWRRAIDSLRPVTERLWAGLPASAREAFVASAARRWDRVRHRIDPDLAAWLDRRCADGSLTVHEGEITAATETCDGLRVELADGTVVVATAVLNCTGTRARVDSPEDPLAVNLIRSGTARRGPLARGLATDAGGRLVGENTGQAAIWALGPLRGGELCESIAIPEIRCQADDIARQIVDVLPVSRPAPSAPVGGVNLRALASRA